jgi:hypothetical protein
LASDGEKINSILPANFRSASTLQSVIECGNRSRRGRFRPIGDGQEFANPKLEIPHPEFQF